MAQLEVFFSSDRLWVMSPFLCFIIVRFDYIVSLWLYIAIFKNPPRKLNIFVIKQQQNLGQRFGTSKMHLSPPPPTHTHPPVTLAAVRSKAVDLLLICCWLFLPLWDSVIVHLLCFVVRCFVPILVLQSSWWGRESELLCLVCLPGVSRLLCGSSWWL